MFRTRIRREEKKIQRRINRLQSEAYRLSTFDRAGSYQLYAEAEKLILQLVEIRDAGKQERP